MKPSDRELFCMTMRAVMATQREILTALRPIAIQHGGSLAAMSIDSTLYDSQAFSDTFLKPETK